MNELIDQLTVSAVNFNTIKSSLHRILGRLRELVNQVPYLLVRQFSRSSVVFIDRYCANSHHFNRIPGSSSAACTENLTENETTVGVHAVNNFFPHGDLSISPDARCILEASWKRGHLGSFCKHKTSWNYGALCVVGRSKGSRDVIVLSTVASEWRHHNPVTCSHFPYC